MSASVASAASASTKSARPIPRHGEWSVADASNRPSLRPRAGRTPRGKCPRAARMLQVCDVLLRSADEQLLGEAAGEGSGTAMLVRLPETGGEPLP